jgi:hypothetical protein
MVTKDPNEGKPDRRRNRGRRFDIKNPGSLAKLEAKWLGEKHGVKVTAAQVRGVLMHHPEFQRSPERKAQIEEERSARDISKTPASKPTKAVKTPTAREKAKITEATATANEVVKKIRAKKTLTKKTPATVTANSGAPSAKKTPAKKVPRGKANPANTPDTAVDLTDSVPQAPGPKPRAKKKAPKTETVKITTRGNKATATVTPDPPADDQTALDAATKAPAKRKRRPIQRKPVDKSSEDFEF